MPLDFIAMPSPIHIPSLPVGARVEDTFLVLDLRVRTMDTGDAFTILTLGNNSGKLPTEPFWPARQDEIAGLRKGHVVQVIGEVGTFRDRRQLKVVSLRQLPSESVNLLALLPSVGAVERYWEALDGWRRELSRPGLRAAVDLFYEDEEFRHKYEQCPGAVYTTEVVAIARTIARASGANVDLVVAGALLHDIGKTESYVWNGIFDYTEAGRLVGHVVLGALMFDRRFRAQPAAPCSAAEHRTLLHFILSHHGRLEWGSPVQPMTLEAEALHWADNASAKTASVADALRDDDNFPEGPFSSALRSLDWRRLFRGSGNHGVP
jgi:3'-5' exoribonuclease